MPRIRRTVPFGSWRAVTDGSRRNDRIAAMEVIGWLTSTPPPSRRPANTDSDRPVPEGVCQRPPTSSCSRRTWAARSAASWASGSLRTAERTSAAVARLASTGGAVRRRDEVGDGGVEVGGGDDDVRQPDRLGLGGAHGAAGQADLHGPRVADQLDEVARAGQVGHQAERGLGQPQLRRRRSSTRRSQASASCAPAPIACPCTAATETMPGSGATGSRPGSPRIRSCASSAEQPAEVAQTAGHAGLGAEQAAVQPGGERAPRAAEHDHADVVVERGPDGGERRPGGRRLRVELVGAVEGDGEDGAVPARADPAVRFRGCDAEAMRSRLLTIPVGPTAAAQ